MIPIKHLSSVLGIESKDYNTDAYSNISKTIPISNALFGHIDLIRGRQFSFDIIVQSTNGNVIRNGANLEFFSNSDPLIDSSIYYTFRNIFGKYSIGKINIDILPTPQLIATADTYDVQQGEQVLISDSYLISNDISTFPPIQLTGVQNPIGGTVSYTQPNITFTSTGLTGDPAGFEYTAIDSFGNTAIGNVLMNVTSLPPIESLLFRDSQTAIDYMAVTIPQSSKEIFDEWGRFDNNTWYPGGTTPSGSAAAWTYDSVNDQIVCTQNTASHTGFISPDLLDNFTLDVTVSSIDNDNDMISVIVAFERQGTINKRLSLTRTCGGADTWGPGIPNWCAVLDLGGQHGGSVTGTVIQSNTSSITAPPSSNWAQSGLSTIRVQRNGNIIKAYCSQFGSTVLEPSTEINIDVSAIPSLNWAMGPKAYGYSAFSQNASTFDNISITGAFLDVSTVYLFSENDVYRYYADTGWTLIPDSTIADELGYPREVFNPETGDRFYIDRNKVITQI